MAKRTSSNRELSKEERADLKEAFAIFDVNRDGKSRMVLCTFECVDSICIEARFQSDLSVLDSNFWICHHGFLL